MYKSYQELDGELVISDPARGRTGSKISRTTTSESQDFSRDCQDLCPFPGLSRPGNLDMLISGLFGVCMNPYFEKY